MARTLATGRVTPSGRVSSSSRVARTYGANVTVVGIASVFSSGSSKTLNYPQGTQQGDLLLLRHLGTNSITTLGSWNLVSNVNWKFAGTESSVTCSVTGNSGNFADMLVVLRGANPTSPISGSLAHSSNSVTTIAAGAVTPSKYRSFSVSFAVTNTSSTGNTLTGPASPPAANVTTTGIIGSRYNIGVCTDARLLPPGRAYTAASWTCSPSATSAEIDSFLIAPAGT